MSYEVKFPTSAIENRFNKILLKISPENLQEKIMSAVEALGSNPYPSGKKIFKVIKPPLELYQLTARYRIRIGDYRVLYDVDSKKKIVWILALRKRNEKTDR